MALKIFNSLSHKEEQFQPNDKDSVGLYTCGPTVYNYPHIGNYRAYIFSDMLKRYLKYRGYKVKHVMNITDVDDKTIKNSIKEGKTLQEFTSFYTEAFFKDRDSLNILPADTYTKATDYISEMVTMIETLLEKGFAYKTADGSVYFDIRKDKEYGKLSHLKIDSLKENAEGRLKKDEYEKNDAQDFALWKAWDEGDGNVFWETSLGKGRPGWHIECSAMSVKNLGETFDIHTGGIDLIFPHHENEIAQSECSTGKPFVKYFMHNEFLMVNGQKMAKSAGNFYTLQDIKDMKVSPLAYRLWLYMAHYRTMTNLNTETLEGANVAYTRLCNYYLNLDSSSSGNVNEFYKDKFIEFMDNDLDTPKALALLWDLVHDNNMSEADKRVTMLDLDKVFGFGFSKLQKVIIPEEVTKIIEERDKARSNRDWKESDKLREEIEKLGYKVKDTEDGTQISKQA